MKQKYILFIFFVILSLSACQKRLNRSISDGVLFKINNQPVLAGEFIYLYEKNNFNNDSIYTKADIKNYLDLFINFKLKVKAAYEEGIDTTASFQKEFNTYKAALIKPYLLATKEADSLVKEVYNRLQTFIHASHILIGVNDFSNPEDTLAAYNKIQKIRNRALAGEDFTQLAKQYSEDPSAKKNGGDLGFFTALQMVYPFENAAYETPVNGISGIVKTQFGYHIIKVHEKALNKGKVKIAHIMVKNSGADSLKAKHKIFEIYDKVAAGDDWNHLVSQYSDDTRTRSNGGELGFISQGQLPAQFHEFEKIAYRLDSAGQVSAPVKSPYGWHILKLLEKQKPESFEAMRSQLERRVARGERSEAKRALIVARLKEEGNFRENTSVFDQLVALAGETNVSGKWNFADSLLNKTLFLLNRQSVSVAQFADYAAPRLRKSSQASLEEQMKQAYNNFVEKKLFEYEEQQIAARHLDYRMLEREYREGLLLFEVMEEHVWNKSTTDSAGLKAFFEKNKGDYTWKERADAIVVKTDRKDLLEKIRTDLERESIVYFRSEIAPDTGALKADTKSVLKKAVQLAQKYPSKFVLEYNPNKVSSRQIEQLTGFLADRGVNEEDVETIETRKSEGDISLALNSRSKKALEEVYNKNSALTLQVEENLFEEGENEMMDQLDWKEGIFELSDGNSFTLIKIREILPQRPKKLNEVKGKVISDFQAYLENEWIDDLKTKYEVTVNEDVLHKIYKYFEDK